MDTYRPDDYNLLQSKVKPVRDMAIHLIKKGEKEYILRLEGKVYPVLADTIPELDWKIMKVLE
jgi:hypothetical protein